MTPHFKEIMQRDSDNEEQLFNCSECDYTSTYKTELKLHMKSHTGESPGKIIDQSFADIVKSPKSFIEAAVNVFSGPNTRSAGRLSFSQSTKGSIENKNPPSTSKRFTVITRLHVSPA